MKRGKKKDAVAPIEVQTAEESAADAPAAEDLTPAAPGSWDGPTRAADDAELRDLVAESLNAKDEAELASSPDGEATAEETVAAAEESSEVTLEASAEEGVEAGAEGFEGLADGTVADGGVADGEDPEPIVDNAVRLESIIESLLYASDRALSVADLKRLVNERDAKKITAALEALRERHANTGIQLASLAGGWQFRTHPENAPWVTKLVAGKPQRLTRAMLETLAIVAYRQPITRPEVDEIRGVDCGPVLKTLLERNYVRILGKKEDVGRPMLYGTTPEFLKTFSLRDLSELPTLREFHELSEQQMATVDAQAPIPTAEAQVADSAAARSPFAPAPMDLTPVDQEEEEALLAELDGATMAATRASGPPPGTTPEAAAPEASEA